MKTTTTLLVAMGCFLLFSTGCSSDDDAMVTMPPTNDEPTVYGSVTIDGSLIPLKDYVLHQGQLKYSYTSEYTVLKLYTRDWASRENGVLITFSFSSPILIDLEMGTYVISDGAHSDGTVDIQQLFYPNKPFFDLDGGTVNISRTNDIYTITWEVSGYFLNEGEATISGHYTGPVVHIYPAW
ncbi:hypothetical protein [Salinimicrobium soli]|uniref:hypothetical protein n=1 Tax=Salinimicrobium soli TaxID=1254399 RepID=UPI003AABF6C9